MSLDICVSDALNRECVFVNGDYENGEKVSLDNSYERVLENGLESTSISVGSIGYSALYESVLSSLGVNKPCNNIMIGPFDWDSSGEVLGVGQGNTFYRWSWLRMCPGFNEQLNLKVKENKGII